MYLHKAETLGLSLYAASVFLPFYHCAGSNVCDGGGRGDIFMLPFFFAPIAFVAMLVASVRIFLSREFASRPDLVRAVYVALSIAIILYVAGFYFQEERLGPILLLAGPIIVPLGIAAYVGMIKMGADRAASRRRR